MSFDFEKPEPLADAVDHLSAKTPIGSALRTREWQQMPALLREQAQFSAGVESARVLQRVHDALQDSIKFVRDPVTGAYKMDRSKFVETLQKQANAEGLRNPDAEKRGTIQDFGSRARLELIFNTQIGLAQGKSFWLQGQDPDILDAFPCQELVRVAARKKPRNWTRRWIEAGGEITDNRMIARKDDPIWTKLSRFGTPYPPFDFNSGMGVREIGRREAERLGVMKPGETITPQTQKLRDDLQASVQGLDPSLRAALAKRFGAQIEIDGDTARWKNRLAEAQPPPDQNPAPAPKPTPAASTPAKRKARPKAPAKTLSPAAPAPAGTPISSKAQIVATREASMMERVLGVIDSLHGDGPLPALPFTNKVFQGAEANYVRPKFGGNGLYIGVKPGIPNAEFVLAHEIGHWLDHMGILSRGPMASQSAPALRTWRRLVLESKAIAEVKKLPLSPGGMEYVMRIREIWARAYAQLIAELSGDASMMKSLQQVLDGKDPAWPAPLQWQAEDFAPIKAEMIRLFTKWGWMK